MADEIVEYLVEKFTVPEIQAARDTVFAAHLANVSEPVTVTSTTFDGDSASGQISISPPMREHFMRQCRMAIARLNSEASTMSAGLGINWAARRLET